FCRRRGPRPRSDARRVHARARSSYDRQASRDLPERLPQGRSGKAPHHPPPTGRPHRSNLMGADDRVDLNLGDLRTVADFALQAAQDVLEIFERAHPEDRRPREAIEAARAFALGAKRGKILRDTALAALRAANEVESDAAAQAARAAMLAA